ncbi:YkgJ family cysteine cluster protein [Flammeovirgaceae bacterium KN852]|uniref:YkgJ family cysteine cluster protein n=2 Tax=Marinigracilibium pacificum TaxID=2729599 RepID=A0A848J1B3_9BACT|nr:YkgJ family cysteine cluster protein [Marinigracilibium pacificum]NMM47022.1 YkgJ family cysteine cluster protein [Marinigracilibium pacificum]
MSKERKQLFRKLKKSKPKSLDQDFQRFHDEAFEVIDCLECANCCKTTSPIFYDADINRLSKTLKMKRAEFIDTYLHIDSEGDYVLNETPCPFLGHENKCIVYESRPTACKEYPHTNRKRQHQILPLTLKNTEVCPAVEEVVKKIEALYSGPQ